MKTEEIIKKRFEEEFQKANNKNLKMADRREADGKMQVYREWLKSLALAEENSLLCINCGEKIGGEF